MRVVGMASQMVVMMADARADDLVSRGVVL
jgi:hypothetical protein